MENLYPYIFKRKSTRQYSFEVLDENIISELMAFADSLEPISKAEYKFKILTDKDIKNILQVKAPNYISFYSEESDNYLINCGYLMQHLDLYLSSKNLGSCWLGMAKPTSKLKAENNLEHIITICFGKSNEDIYRKSIAEYNRKPLSDITYSGGNALEAIRLAPSATNSQPWFIVEKDNVFALYRVKLNFAKKIIYNKMNQVDMGIALCHLKTALEREGKQTEIFFEKPDDLENFEYAVSLKVL